MGRGGHGIGLAFWLRGGLCAYVGLGEIGVYWLCLRASVPVGESLGLY